MFSYIFLRPFGYGKNTRKIGFKVSIFDRKVFENFDENFFPRILLKFFQKSEKYFSRKIRTTKI